MMHFQLFLSLACCWQFSSRGSHTYSHQHDSPSSPVCYSACKSNFSSVHFTRSCCTCVCLCPSLSQLVTLSCSSCSGRIGYYLVGHFASCCSLMSKDSTFIWCLTVQSLGTVTAVGNVNDTHHAIILRHTFLLYTHTHMHMGSAGVFMLIQQYTFCTSLIFAVASGFFVLPYVSHGAAL